MMPVSLQIVFALIIMTALICGTVLALQAHTGMAVVMVVFALAALFVIGGIEMGTKRRTEVE